MVWGAVLAIAVGGLLMGILIIACSDVHTYLDLQRRLKKERMKK